MWSALPYTSNKPHATDRKSQMVPFFTVDQLSCHIKKSHWSWLALSYYANELNISGTDTVCTMASLMKKLLKLTEVQLCILGMFSYYKHTYQCMISLV